MKKYIVAMVSILLLSAADSYGNKRYIVGENPDSSDKIERRPQLEDFIIRFTNQIRREYGLRQLDYDHELMRISRRHSDDMIQRNYVGHVSPEGYTAVDRVSARHRTFIGVVAENIWLLTGSWKGVPYNDTSSPILMAKRIVDEWMASPTHRKNILTEGLTHIGVGISQSYGKMLVTQLLVHKVAGLQEPLDTVYKPGDTVFIDISAFEGENEYLFTLEKLQRESKDKFGPPFTLQKAVVLPQDTGHYRLVMLVDKKDQFMVYRGPVITIQKGMAKKEHTVTAYHNTIDKFVN